MLTTDKSKQRLTRRAQHVSDLNHIKGKKAHLHYTDTSINNAMTTFTPVEIRRRHVKLILLPTIL
jgi:hypothetical protein